MNTHMGFKAASIHFFLVICAPSHIRARTHTYTYTNVHALVYLIEEKVVQRDGEGRCARMSRRVESGALRDEPFDT